MLIKNLFCSRDLNLTIGFTNFSFVKPVSQLSTTASARQLYILQAASLKNLINEKFIKLIF